MAKYDLIVIGAGHNGLVAAARLAKHGLKTLVLEKSSLLGGCSRTDPNIFPGYKVDPGAQQLGHSLLRIAKELELEKFGLEVIRMNVSMRMLAGKNIDISFYKDLDATCNEIARYSKEEADNYRRFITDWAPFIYGHTGFLHNLEPSYTRFFQVVEALGPQMLYLIMGKASDIVRSYFPTDWVCTVLGRLLLAEGTDPREPGSGMACQFQASYHAAAEWRPRGGMESLMGALAKAIQHHGGEVRTDSGVRKIIIEDKKAKGVRLESGEEIEGNIIVSATHIKRTYFDFVGEEHLDPGFSMRIKNLAEGNSVFRVFLALDGKPELDFRDVIIGEGFRQYEDACDAISRGRLPEKPMLYVVNRCEDDPSLAPPGKCWICIFAVAPYKLVGTTWNTERERYAELMVDTAQTRIPNLKRHIIDQCIKDPLDLEREMNLPQAPMVGPRVSIDQMFSMRPAYRSPIKNLYISGTGVHPGGGALGAPGYNTSAVVMQDLEKGK